VLAWLSVLISPLDIPMVLCFTSVTYFFIGKKLLPLTTSEVTTLRHDTNMFIIIIIIITLSEKQRMDGLWVLGMLRTVGGKKGKGSPYSIT